MQLGQTVKSRSYSIVVVSALLATGGFADVAAKPPTRELTEIEKTMSRALEFEMLRLDACFVHDLAGFILAHELPPAFFSSLDAAYGTGALPAGACPSALPGSDATGALDMLRHAARERRHGGAQPTLWDRLAQRLRGKGN